MTLANFRVRVRPLQTIRALHMVLFCKLFARWLFFASAAFGVLAAQTEGLRLPANLPLSRPRLTSGMGFEDAFPLRFDQPIGIVTAPNETRRLFVIERKG